MSTLRMDWYHLLQRQAESRRHSHVDLLIDTTGLAAPLPETQAGLDHALLFEGTPEQPIATTGPRLVRIHLNDSQQIIDAQGLIAAAGQDRLLALVSPWPFESLAAHLRSGMQASWGNGRHEGLLRYYDPRVFRGCCECLLPEQSRQFHAPVITWHWRDRDGRDCHLAGHYRPPQEMGQPFQGLALREEQCRELHAWSEAAQYIERHALVPHEQGLPTREALLRHMLHGHLAAARKNIASTEREAFLRNWLDRQAPRPQEQ